MFQSYHRLAPTDPDPMATDYDPRPFNDALFADWKAMAKTARQSLDAAERAQLAYSTVLDAYRTEEDWAEQWLKEALASRVVIRDLRGDNAMLRAQVTELLGQLDKATGRSTYHDPLRLVERRSAYRVEATS